MAAGRQVQADQMFARMQGAAVGPATGVRTVACHHHLPMGCGILDGNSPPRVDTEESVRETEIEPGAASCSLIIPLYLGLCVHPLRPPVRYGNEWKFHHRAKKTSRCSWGLASIATQLSEYSERLATTPKQPQIDYWGIKCPMRSNAGNPGA